MVLGVYPGRLLLFGYGTFTLCGRHFHAVLLNNSFVTPRQPCSSALDIPSTPYKQRLQPLTSVRFRLFPFRSPLLRKSRLLSLPPATKMFQFTGSGPSLPMGSGVGDTCSQVPGSPIRVSTDLRSLAATRGISPLAAPFFASWRLGIHRTPSYA